MPNISQYFLWNSFQILKIKIFPKIQKTYFPLNINNIVCIANCSLELLTAIAIYSFARHIYIYIYFPHCSSIPVTETHTFNWIFYFFISKWRETWENWLFPVKFEPINSEQAICSCSLKMPIWVRYPLPSYACLMNLMK